MEYIFACILLGIGIAVDVTLATIAMYPRFQRISLGFNWISKVTFTHILFPMIGYYGFAYVYRMMPELNLILGLVAAIAIFWFLGSAFRELRDLDSPDTGSYKDISWVIVLGVSWDALWSGPAKSAQAINWTNIEVFLSFIIAGAVVALFAYLSVVIAVYMNRTDLTKPANFKRRAQRETGAACLEYSVIGYFGLLAIDRYIIGLNTYWPLLLAASFILWALLFLINWKSLVQAREHKY